MSNLKTPIYTSVDAILAAETTTTKEVSYVSRALLIYVPDSNDIDVVNRLVNGLSPVNRKVAILFFKHFLPWEAEMDGDKFVRFGKKMQGEKKIARRMTLIKEFLKDEKNDMWTWGDANVVLKQKDFKASIQRAIKKAMDGDKKTNTPPMTHVEVMDAIFGTDLTFEDFQQGLERLTLAQQEIEAQQEAELAGAEELAAEAERQAA